MDEHEVRRHTRLLEDRIDLIAETQTELLDKLEDVASLMHMIWMAVGEAPETGVPENSDADGRVH